VDKDKRVIGEIIGQFAPTRCLELGCATGPVLKLLCEARIDAQDVEVSQLALALASPLIRKRIRLGDLLSLRLEPHLQYHRRHGLFEI